MDHPLQTLLRRFRRLTETTGAGALTDAQLLGRFVSGRDEAALEVLVWRHGAMVYNLCRRLLRHEHDAEDAFQATFLALARKAHTVCNREALGSWLYKVAYRVALAARAGVAERAALEQACVDVPAAEGDDEVVWNDLRPVLDEEVNRLPAKYRAAFVLCYLEGRTNEEAARQLGCPKGTVLSRLARARERLRARLTRRGLGVSAGALGAVVSKEGRAGVLPATLVGETVTIALAAGSGAAGRVAALTEGVLRTMSLTKLKIAVGVLLAAGLLGVAAMGNGVFAGGRESGDGESAPGAEPAGQRKPQGDPRKDEVMQAAMRHQQSINNLKQIGLALHNYHDTYKRFPAPAIYDKNGKALLSWRVTILPFLEQNHLYQRFRLDEPWNSPHNKELLKEMPPLYAPVGEANPAAGKTYYQAFVGPHAGFESGKKLRLFEFTDGTSNTLWVVEAGSPVPWTKPEDLPFAADKPLPKLGGLFGGNFHALWVDGSVSFLSRDAAKQELRAAITRDGGEVIDRDKLEAKNVFAWEGKLDAKRLPEHNTRLKDLLRAIAAEAVRERDNLEILKAKVVLNSPEADAKTAKLLKEHAELQEAVQRALNELDALRAERARLERMLDERLRKKE
jgi:RNA polymerase sigma factor (sigma-70 family)